MPLALISVHDKTGLVGFAKRLAAQSWRILASGGTAATLRDAGIESIEVAAYTGSAELLGGRVKTLHPAIHAGILARSTAEDLDELHARGFEAIDLVVVNLYPFEETVQRVKRQGGEGVEAEVIEQIDIGGVALLRAAAKNFKRVTVVSEPADYELVANELEQGGTTRTTRHFLATKAFARTATYDAAIAAWFSQDQKRAAPDEKIEIQGYVERTLRYGENPHQKAFFMMQEAREPQASAATSAAAHSPKGPLGGCVLGGKELSYNNILDLDAAWRTVCAFDAPAAVIVKHLSPCGAAEADCARAAYEAALACDPVSAFGGIVALNRPLDAETARALKELFLECVAAPSFDETALNMLKEKKNLRLVEADDRLFARQVRELRSAAGGILVQEPDHGDPSGTEWRVVSARAPSPAEMEAMRFAWKLVQAVKSNAIVLAQGRAAVGIGGGQTNRVDAVRQACERAGERARGAVMASDAYFPFPDSIEAAAGAGVTAVVHPGGSVRDAEVLAAADRRGLAVVYTGVRHFRH